MYYCNLPNKVYKLTHPFRFAQKDSKQIGRRSRRIHKQFYGSIYIYVYVNIYIYMYIYICIYIFYVEKEKMR
jgi:hypothetical protein